MYDLLENGWPDAENNKAMTQQELPLDNKIIQKLLLRREYTPDFSKLRLHQDIIIMVYDSMRVGGFQNHFLKNAKLLGECRTAHNGFIMRSGVNPVVFSDNDNGSKQKGFIRGDAFAVSPELFLDIDWLRSNGKVYQRTQKHVFLLDQEYPTRHGNKKPTVQAWMWLGVPEFWKKENLTISPSTLPNGDRNKRYYEFLPSHVNRHPHHGHWQGHPDGMEALRWMH
jgi:gamma-glutamylcyclotransferase (GGCT)/AIG2-like uncharacterized protein YtfP